MISLSSRFMMFMLLAMSLTGQDLNTAWQDYMATNANLSNFESERAVYTQEQIDIKREVNQLQKNSAWYNAWVNKYLLANHSKRQLVILDSLRVLDARLDRLHAIQEGEIGRLKLAYEDLIEDYENEGIIPAQQDLREMQFSNFKHVTRPNPILFPDYTEVLGIEWRNPEQRRLLLKDVQNLLQDKIVELDSIKIVRGEEAELALRLADFHEDLGLQMASDQDAQQRDASGESEKMLGWQYTDASTSPTANEYAVDDGRTGLDMAIGLSAEAMDLININVPREEVREMSLEQRSGRDLNYLKKKLGEYEDLLEQINQELNQSP